MTPVITPAHLERVRSPQFEALPCGRSAPPDPAGQRLHQLTAQQIGRRPSAVRRARRVPESDPYVPLAATLPQRQITHGGDGFRMDPLAISVAQRPVTLVLVGLV